MIANLSRRPGLRQLIKFCIVGASSTVIDKGIYRLLLFSLAPGWPWWLSQSIAFCFGVTNGYIWNRLWTFRHQKRGEVSKQYPLFVATNVIGLLLNLLITKLFLIGFTGQLVHRGQNPDPNHAFLASLCAIPLVVVWNFSAAKFLTFRTPKNAQNAARLSDVSSS